MSPDTLPLRATRAQVMTALRERPMLEQPSLIELPDLQRLLPPETAGVMDTLLALAEYDLVEVLPADRVSGRPARAFLTQQGRKWLPTEWPSETYVWDDNPMRYVYRNHGFTSLGTMHSYAHAWGHNYYAGMDLPEPMVMTWHNRVGYPVYADRVTATPDEIRYRFWVAGEDYFLTLDGRA